MAFIVIGLAQQSRNSRCGFINVQALLLETSSHTLGLSLLPFTFSQILSLYLANVIATDSLIGASYITSCLMCSLWSASTYRSDNWFYMATLSLTSSEKAKAANFSALTPNSPGDLPLIWVNFMGLLIAFTAVPSSTYSPTKSLMPTSSPYNSVRVNRSSFTRWLPINSETSHSAALYARYTVSLSNSSYMSCPFLIDANQPFNSLRLPIKGRNSEFPSISLRPVVTILDFYPFRFFWPMATHFS